MKKQSKHQNRRLYQTTDNKQHFKLRVFEQKASKRRARRLTVKCGCCSEKVEIYPPGDGVPLIEINGVLASREEWGAIFWSMLGLPISYAVSGGTAYSGNILPPCTRTTQAGDWRVA
jgi:hypothetical protein